MDKMTFKALFDHSSLGIIISNVNGVIVRSNPFAAKIFGYAEGELDGQVVEVLIPSHLRERHVTYREKYTRNPQPRAMGSTLNLMAVKKNGQQFPVEISLTYYEADGERQIVSFVNDITERKRAEDDLRKLTEELETKVTERTRELSDALLELGHTNEVIRAMLEKEKELNELKSRFVSMASHEFRTPLGGIMTSASLIEKYPTTEDEPKRHKHIQNIKKSVKNLTGILNDFLSLDKLDQGKFSASPTAFDFIAFIQEIVEEIRETSDKRHTFALVHSVPELQIFQDKEMIRNVVINLISNAIKYSPEKGTIRVEARVTGDNLVLTISDEGMGIPLADQKHLFERFFRAKNVTNLQGTGLGLNIVKRYLDMLGGDISFKSVENQGTSFYVSIPLEKK